MPRRYLSLAFIIALGVLAALRPSGDADAIDPRLESVIALYRREGAEKALTEFEKLAKEFGAAGKTRDETTAIHYIGECHWRLGDFDAARKHLDRRLAIERESKDRHSEGKTLNVRGLLAWDLGHYEDAMADFRMAGAIGREVQDRKLEGSSLNNLSLVYDELGQYDVSLKQYQQVLELYRDADFPRGEGDTLGNIGGVHLLLGRFREALAYYRQALEVSERLGSKSSMSQDHGNIALCLLGLGEVDSAIEHFDRAIELARQAGMRQDEAYWLGGKANGFIQKGRYDQGLGYHRASLAIYEDVGAQAELLQALHDLGRLYLLLGDPDSAQRDFTQALELARTIGLARGITQNLIALGDLRFSSEQYDAANALFAEARQRAEQSKEQYLLAESLLRLGLVHREQGRVNEAAVETQRALGIAREIESTGQEAEALLALAELDRRGGRSAEALKGFDAAEKTLSQIGDPEVLWQIYYGQALAHEARGEVADAIDALTAAVKLIESVRERLQEPRFRAGYVEDKYEVYVDLVRLQLKLGLTGDAFTTAERLRARSYVQQVAGRSTVPLSEDDRRTETQLRERIRQLRKAISAEEGSGPPSQRQQAFTIFSRELLAAEQAYEAFLDDREGVRHTASAARTTTASKVQSRLAEDEALLEYVVGRNNVTVFVVTPREITATVRPLKRSDLESRIALLRDLIRRPGDERWLKPASSLSGELLQPIEAAGLLDGARHLYIVPHGSLNYLPFALLPRTVAGSRREADHLLIDGYTLAQLPAAAVLMSDASRADGPPSLLAVAPSRSRLRHAPEEARSIDALYQPHSRLLIGEGATESRFKKLASDYRVLHLATHGYFNKLNPLLSGLELEADGADDGLLQVHEVLGLRLAADLVTLSACETALGSGYFTEVPAGDEFVGMTRAFLAAGTESVMATLWEVDDAASMRLMQRFYAALHASSSERSKAVALAEAQRELQANEAFRHPYYWAPFVLVGNEHAAVGKQERLAGRSI